MLDSSDGEAIYDQPVQDFFNKNPKLVDPNDKNTDKEPMIVHWDNSIDDIDKDDITIRSISTGATIPTFDRPINHRRNQIIISDFEHGPLKRVSLTFSETPIDFFYNNQKLILKRSCRLRKIVYHT